MLENFFYHPNQDTKYNDQKFNDRGSGAKNIDVFNLKKICDQYSFCCKPNCAKYRFEDFLEPRTHKTQSELELQMLIFFYLCN